MLVQIYRRETREDEEEEEEEGRQKVPEQRLAIDHTVVKWSCLDWIVTLLIVDMALVRLWEEEEQSAGWS